MINGYWYIVTQNGKELPQRFIASFEAGKYANRRLGAGNWTLQWRSVRLSRDNGKRMGFDPKVGLQEGDYRLCADCGERMFWAKEHDCNYCNA